MRRPRIGITSDYVNGKPQYMTTWSYPEAVERAGGLAFMLPYKTDPALAGQYVDHLDGLILSGGDDIDPSLWDEAKHPMAGHLDPDRQRFELALLAEVEKRAMPVLGICLGSQMMNVYRGGSLHQFLPDMPRDEPLEHRRIGDDWSFRHTVTVDAHSKLAHVLGTTTVESNSSHKQSVHTLGKGLHVVAHSPDGIVEATEDPSFPFFLGVQWHPEKQNDEAVQLRLFQALVQHAMRRANGG